MRLRHKKPTNSYTGQANPDTSSAHDEDFDKNQTPSRRQKFVKPKPVTEQTKKYAEILLEFVGVVNQNFRSHVKENDCFQAPYTKKDRIEPNLALSAKQNIFIGDQAHGKTEVVSKQQQKIRKSESLPQKFPPQTKKIRKERVVVEEPPKKKEIPIPSVQHPIPPPPNQPKPPQISNLIDLTSNEKPQQNAAKLPNIQNLQNIFQNPFMMMNQAMFNPMALQMAMMTPSNIQEMKNDPNMMPYLSQLQNMFGMMPIMMQNMQNMQNAQGGKNNYIPFNQLPFLNNQGKQALSKQIKKLQEAQQEALKRVQQAQNQNSAQKNFISQTTKRAAQPKYKPQTLKVQKNQTESNKIPSFPEIPISKKKEIEGLKVQSLDPDSLSKISPPMLPNFNKKASNHVSIAYNIHFHHLREKGMINNNLSQMKSTDDLKIIDPTYPARKIRERKNSDNNVTGLNKPCQMTP